MSLNLFSIPIAILISRVFIENKINTPAFPIQGYLTAGVGILCLILGVVFIISYSNKNKQKYMIPFYSIYFLIFIIISLLLYSLLSYQAKPDYNAALIDITYPFELLASVAIPFALNYALVGLITYIKKG